MVATDRTGLPRGDMAVRLAQLLSEEAAAADVGARLDAVQHSRGRAAGSSAHYGSRHGGQRVRWPTLELAEPVFSHSLQPTTLSNL